MSTNRIDLLFGLHDRIEDIADYLDVQRLSAQNITVHPGMLTQYPISKFHFCVCMGFFCVCFFLHLIL